jgi:hypothetical protein
MGEDILKGAKDIISGGSGGGGSGGGGGGVWKQRM